MMLKIPKYQDVKSREKAIKYSITTVLVIYCIQGLFCLVLGGCLLGVIYVSDCHFLRTVYVEDISLIVSGIIMLFLTVYSTVITSFGHNMTQLRYFIAALTVIIGLELTATISAHVNWNTFENLEIKTLSEKIFSDKSECVRTLSDRFSCCALAIQRPPCIESDRFHAISNSCICNASDNDADCRQVHLTCGSNKTITISGTSCEDAILGRLEYQTTFIRVSSSLVIITQIFGFLTLFVFVSKLSRSRVIAQYVQKSNPETDTSTSHI